MEIEEFRTPSGAVAATARPIHILRRLGSWLRPALRQRIADGATGVALTPDRILLCYDPTESEFAHRVGETLSLRAPLRGIEYRHPTRAVLDDEVLGSALAFLFVATTASLGSDFCRHQLARAAQMKVPVFTIIRDDSAVPPRLARLETRIMCRTDREFEHAIEQLVKAISADVRVDVFICYSRKDFDFSRELYRALKERRFNTWIDLESIPLAGAWKDEILRAIEAADNFIFIISPESIVSNECANELAHAVQHGKRIIPVLRRDIADKKLPPMLSPLQYIPFQSNEKDDLLLAFDRLTQALNTDLGHVRDHTRLLRRALDWHDAREDASLLLVGKDLARAERFLAEQGHASPRSTSLQVRYVVTSRRTEGARQARVRGALIIGLALAVLLSIAALIERYHAVQERDEANRQRQAALGRQLAAESRLLISRQPHLLPRAVLLAIEAMRRSPSIHSDQVLRDEVALLPRIVAKVQFRDAVRAAAFSHNGRYIATACSDGNAAIWDAATGHNLGNMKHGGEVTSVGFSPDDRYVASGSADRSARIWESSTGRIIATMAHPDKVNSVAFSSDGRYVATAGEGRVVGVWLAALALTVSTWPHSRGSQFGCGECLDSGWSVAFSMARRCGISHSALTVGKWRRRAPTALQGCGRFPTSSRSQK